MGQTFAICEKKRVLFINLFTSFHGLNHGHQIIVKNNMIKIKNIRKLMIIKTSREGSF